MAATTELEKLQIRKARLIKQNDAYRQELLAEADNLRDAAGLIERGHGLYKAVARLGNWSLLSIFRPKKKQNSVRKVLKGFAVGFRFLRGLMAQPSNGRKPDDFEAKHVRSKQGQPDCDLSVRRF